MTITHQTELKITSGRRSLSLSFAVFVISPAGSDMKCAFGIFTVAWAQIYYLSLLSLLARKTATLATRNFSFIKTKGNFRYLLRAKIGNFFEPNENFVEMKFGHCCVVLATFDAG